MKQRSAVHILYILLTVWVIAVTVLTLTACNRNEAIPVCPSLPQETVGGLSCALVEAPAMKIHYQDAEAVSSATLTPSFHTHILGSAFPSGTRPCEQEHLCTVTLADTVGEVRLAYFPEEMNAIENAEFYAAEALTDLTLTAYPAAEDGTVDLSPEQAQTIPVANARFTLLVGRYYYELTVPQDNGLLTYGFIAHRIDAEEYKVSETVSGCCVEVSYEDPDHMVKQLPALHMLIPFGREGNAKSGHLLPICGRIVHTYINHADTRITRTIDLGNPMTSENIPEITTAQLNIDYEIEWPWSHKVTAAHYERYTHDGTLLDGKTLVAADVQATNTVHLEPNCYYVFTVYYKDLSAQYVLKTGKGVDEIAAHPQDALNIDPALAKYLRAAHMQYFHVSTQTLDTVDLSVYRYLGQYDGMEAVIFDEPNSDCQCMRGEETLTLGGQIIPLPDGRQLYFYHTHRFYYPEEAYQNGWITDADVTAIIARLSAQ